MPYTLNESLYAASASYSISDNFSGNFSLTNQDGGWYAGCFDNCVPIRLKYGVQGRVGLDVAGSSAISSLYAANDPFWINGIIGSYSETASLESDTISMGVSSFFTRLKSTPVYTETFSAPIATAITDILTIYLGVEGSLITNSLSSAITFSGLVQGQDSLAEMRNLAQAAGGNMYVQVGGKLEFSPWKDQDSAVDFTIPKEWAISASKSTSAPVNSYLISATGAQQSIMDAGTLVFTSSKVSPTNLGGYSSSPGANTTHVLSGIGAPKAKINVTNLAANKETIKNAELVSATGPTEIEETSKSSIADGVFQTEVKKSSGDYFRDDEVMYIVRGRSMEVEDKPTIDREINDQLVDQINAKFAKIDEASEAAMMRSVRKGVIRRGNVERSVQDIYKYGGMGIKPGSGRESLDQNNREARAKANVVNSRKPYITTPNTIVGGPAGGKGQRNRGNNNVRPFNSNPGQNQSQSALSVAVIDINQTGYCGFTSEAISNVYADSPEKLTRILKRRYQELYLDANTMTITCPYMSWLKINDVIQFYTPGTNEMPQRIVKAIIAGIQTQYSADPSSVEMSLTVWDVSCLTGERELQTSNLIAGANGGFEADSSPFTVGSATTNQIVQFQNYSLFIASAGGGASSPNCSYFHADATVGDEYTFSCYVQKTYPLNAYHPTGTGIGNLFPVTYSNSEVGIQTILEMAGNPLLFTQTFVPASSSFTLQFYLNAPAEAVGYIVSNWTLTKKFTI
jgi:5-hydroxyisourate hydrolase-like protein (transthyretin family)